MSTSIDAPPASRCRLRGVRRHPALRPDADARGANLWLERGDPARARALLKPLLMLFLREQLPDALARTHANLGAFALELRDFPAASMNYADALPPLRRARYGDRADPRALKAVGVAILPLLVDKLRADENFPALVLYDDMQSDVDLVIGYAASDPRAFEGEQTRAARTGNSMDCNAAPLLGVSCHPDHVLD